MSCLLLDCCGEYIDTDYICDWILLPNDEACCHDCLIEKLAAKGFSEDEIDSVLDGKLSPIMGAL